MPTPSIIDHPRSNKIVAMHRHSQQRFNFPTPRLVQQTFQKLNNLRISPGRSRNLLATKPDYLAFHQNLLKKFKTDTGGVYIAGGAGAVPTPQLAHHEPVRP